MLLRQRHGGDLLGGRLSRGASGTGSLALLVTWDGRQHTPVAPREAARDYEVVFASTQELQLLRKGSFRRMRIADSLRRAARGGRQRGEPGASAP
jgi:hypothetical protein